MIQNEQFRLPFPRKTETENGIPFPYSAETEDGIPTEFQRKFRGIFFSFFGNGISAEMKFDFRKNPTSESSFSWGSIFDSHVN